jgi:hypothetical protein
LRFGKNGKLVSLLATGKAQKGGKLFVVWLMPSSSYWCFLAPEVDLSTMSTWVFIGHGQQVIILGLN